MPHAVGRARSDYLTGWKEISSYLGVSPRTAQLWEKKYGLPVKRIGGSQGAVRVLVAELDEWRRRRAAEEDPYETAAEGAEPVANRRGPRRYVWVGVAAAAVLLAVTAWTVRPREFVVPAPDRVVEMPEVINDPYVLSLSPDGQRAAFIATVAGSDGRALHVVDLSIGLVETLGRKRIREGPTAWSPDGRKIAMVPDGRQLHVVPHTGGPSTVLADLPSVGARGLDWSNDGKTILVAAYRAGIVEVDVGTGHVTQVHDQPYVEDAQYVSIRGRRAVLFSFRDRNPGGRFSLTAPVNVALLFPETEEIEALFTLAQSAPSVRYHPAGFVLHASGTPMGQRVLATPIDSREPRESIVVSTNGYAAAVTADGKVAVLGGHGYPLGLARFDRSGARTERLGGDLVLLRIPRVSRDGRQAVVYGSDGIDTGYWLMSGGEASLLTPFGYALYGVSTWRPDGRMIAHEMLYSDGPHVEFVSVEDPSERRAIPTDWFLPDDWSKDGRALLGTQRSEGRRLLWLLPVDGSGPGEPALVAPGHHWDGRWSPDQRLMCYGRRLDDERHVLVRWADAPKDDPGVVVAENARQPRWTQDGSEVLYERDGVLYAVPIRTQGDMIVPGIPDQERFRLPAGTHKRMYDVSPDGESVVVAGPAGENPRLFSIEVWDELELP